MGLQGEPKSIAIIYLSHSPQAFGKTFGIAVLAAGTNLRASRNRVPRCISPFNMRIIGHGSTISPTLRGNLIA